MLSETPQQPALLYIRDPVPFSLNLAGWPIFSYSGYHLRLMAIFLNYLFDKAPLRDFFFNPSYTNFRPFNWWIYVNKIFIPRIFHLHQFANWMA